MFEQALGRDRGFLVATEFLVLCCDRGSLCRRQLLGRDIVFPCYDSALFLCHDNVVTEVFLLRPRRP